MAVIDKFPKGAKAASNGGRGARPPRKGVGCEAKEHIIAKCLGRAARHAAEREDATMGGGKDKGKGKAGGSEATGKGKFGRRRKQRQHDCHRLNIFL